MCLVNILPPPLRFGGRGRGASILLLHIVPSYNRKARVQILSAKISKILTDSHGCLAYDCMTPFMTGHLDIGEGAVVPVFLAKKGIRLVVRRVSFYLGSGNKYGTTCR